MHHAHAPSFIELDRTFQDLRADDDAGDDGELRATLLGRKHLGWADLLKEPRTVLLAEAGSGKTAEIRAVAQRLRADGHQAFFLRLEHIKDHLEDAFEVGTFSDFETWRTSGEPGWLLLDSVDEARLHSAKDFQLALKRMGRKLGSALNHTNILITSRTTAWRPVSDLQMVITELPYERPALAAADPVAANDQVGSAANVRSRRKKDEAERRLVRIVGLDHLRPDQIRTFLAARGVGDADAFLDAVERADASMFTARPQDLEELIDFWQTNSRIGSRLEIIQASISRRLAERDPDRAEAQPLTAEKAMAGAMLLAAATTFTRESRIKIPDAVPGSRGLALNQVLQDWTVAECTALSQRPLFETPVYGSVRFHHRSVREYLAAEWLRRLLDRAGSRRRIEQLFFRRQYNLPIVVPSTRPLLPWLAILDSAFLERILEEAPEIIFEGGDPKRLPLATRENVLREACEQLSEPAHGRSMLDYSAVQRFAGSDIAPILRELLRKHAEDDNIVWFLLRLVWHGEVKEALPEVKQAALDSREKYARAAAFHALQAIGTEQDKEEVRAALLLQGSELDRTWLDELIPGLPLDDAAVDWLGEALKIVKPEKKFEADSLSDTLGSYIDQLAPDQAAKLVQALAVLLATEPVLERRNCRISEHYAWLAQFAARAIGLMVEARSSAALLPEVLELLRLTGMARAYHSLEMKQAPSDLAGKVQAWPEFNHRLFWHSVAAERASRSDAGERLDDYRFVSIYGSHWGFGPEDFETILAEVRERPDPDDRKVALTLAFRLFVEADRPTEWREMLRQAAAGTELWETLQRLEHPPEDGSKDWKAQERRWAAQARKREEQERAAEEEWREYVSKHVDVVARAPEYADGRIANVQAHLLQKMRDRSDEHGKWTEGEWERLLPSFGPIVARAFRDGATATWRSWSPPLLSEGREANTTPYASVLGLAGLAIEFRENPDFVKTLTPALAEKAVRHGLEELNGFPVWMEALYRAHPEIVAKIVLAEIEHELACDDGNGDSHYALYRASWAGQWMWDRLGPELLRSPHLNRISQSNLSSVLTIVHGSSITDSELAVVAAQQSQSSGTPERAAIWFATWTGVDPNAAIPAFEAHLAQLEGDQQRTHMAMIYATTLLGSRRSGSGTRHAFRTVPHLKSIYILMNRHIRQADDIQRAGTGVYSPGLRDDAQDARSAVFSFLNDIPGKEAYLALLDLSLLHPDEGSRPWMAQHAKTKAEKRRRRSTVDAGAVPAICCRS